AEAVRRAGSRAYVKIGTSGTGGMGFNIPYTHSEERPSRTLLTKSAVAGAHSLQLFLMGRTAGSPATVEIKPTATIAWREIAYGPVRRKGKPIPLVDCPAPLPVAAAFRPGATGWQETGQALDGAYIDVGENGLFARDEFATVTALGQMEFITPEEVADYVIMELEGRATGKDTVAALDAATAGPTYRAGVLREYALARLDALERERGPAVAYDMLRPPRRGAAGWTCARRSSGSGSSVPARWCGRPRDAPPSGSPRGATRTGSRSAPTTPCHRHASRPGCSATRTAGSASSADGRRHL